MSLFTIDCSFINYEVYEILKGHLMDIFHSFYIVMWGYVGFRGVLYFVWTAPLTLAIMTMRGLTFQPCTLIVFING